MLGSDFWRKIVLVVLVPLTCVLAVASASVIWAHATLLDTDNWVETTAPLLDDPRIVNSLSTYLADQINVTLNVQQRAAEALPERAAFLAAPLADATGRFVQTHVTKVLNSPETDQVWVEANRVAHQQLMAVLRGQSQLVDTSNGMVNLDLGALVLGVLRRIDVEVPGLVQRVAPLPATTAGQPPSERRANLARALGIQVPADFGLIPLFPASTLNSVQGALRLFDILTVALPIITLLLCAAVIFLFRDRWLGALVLAAGMLVAFILARVLVPELLGVVVSGLPRAAGQEFLTAALQILLDGLASVLIFGVLLSGTAVVVIVLLTWANRLARARAEETQGLRAA